MPHNGATGQVRVAGAERVGRAARSESLHDDRARVRVVREDLLSRHRQTSKGSAMMISPEDPDARLRLRNRSHRARRLCARLLVVLAFVAGAAGGTALGYRLAVADNPPPQPPRPGLITGSGPSPAWGLTSVSAWDSDGTSLVVLSRPETCHSECTGSVTLYDLGDGPPSARWSTEAVASREPVQLWAGKVIVGHSLLSQEDGASISAPWPEGSSPTLFEDARTALDCREDDGCTAWAPDGSMRWRLTEGAEVVDSQCASGTPLGSVERHVVLCESQHAVGEAAVLDLDSGTASPLVPPGGVVDLSSLVVLPAADGWLTVPTGFRSSGGRARLWSADGVDQGSVDAADALALVHNRQPLTRTPPTLAQYRAAVEQNDTGWAEVVLATDDDSCDLMVSGRRVVPPERVCALQSDRPTYMETGRLSADGSRVLFDGDHGDRMPAVLDLESHGFLAMPPAPTRAEKDGANVRPTLVSSSLLVTFDDDDRTLRGYDLTAG